MSRFGTTLGRFLQDEQRKHPDLDPGIGDLLTQMAYASKIIAREVGRAALVGKLGLVGERNATGDSQKKLDVFGSEAAGEEREAEVANGDLAAESFSKLRLDGGAKALCVDEEGNQENSEDQNGGDRDCNLHPGFFHGDAP